MLATFFVEIILAVYVLWRYGLDRVTRIVALILVNLAVFQAAEFMVCEGAFGLDSLQWARIGYVAITLLPPLGIHLGLRLSGKKNPLLLSSAYGSAAIFAGIFLFAGQGMQSHVCQGNYVIFEIANWASLPYGLYYYGWLLAGIGLALSYAEKTSKKHIRKALHGLAVGYTAFIVPTTAVNLLEPSTTAGIPSIMCGFAVLFAFSMVFWVVPEYKRDRRKVKFLKLAK